MDTSASLGGKVEAPSIMEGYVSAGPYPANSIPDVLAGDDRFEILMQILEQHAPNSYLEIISDPTISWTLLAPTDEAFDAIDPKVMDALLRPENGPALRCVACRHI